MRRFQNLGGKKCTPQSLGAYLSRVQSSISDFSSYIQNPLGFKPRSQNREKKKTDDAKENSGGSESIERSSRGGGAATQSSRLSILQSSSLLPIPIRSDVTVYVQGIPFDLTEAEAGKIAKVIRAMASGS
jgi:hypothetical protein